MKIKSIFALLLAIQFLFAHSIPAGTRISVRLVAPFNTDLLQSCQKSNNQEQPCLQPQFLVADNIFDLNTNQLLIAANTPVDATTKITYKKGLGRPAKIEVEFFGTKTINNHPVNLKGFFVREGINKMGTSIGLAAGLGFFISPFFFFFLMKKGGSAQINVGEIIPQVYVQ